MKMKALPVPEFLEEMEHLDSRILVLPPLACRSFAFFLLIFCLYIAPLLNVAWTGLIFLFSLSIITVFCFFIYCYLKQYHVASS